jgi:AbrB family looped-hinge helix DNA binding protein
MSGKAKITSKGQITVPREVRHALGVKPGDSLVFELDGDEVCVRPLRRKSVFAKYRGIGNPGIASGREAVLREIDELRGHELRKK